MSKVMSGPGNPFIFNQMDYLMGRIKKKTPYINTMFCLNQVKLFLKIIGVDMAINGIKH